MEVGDEPSTCRVTASTCGRDRVRITDRAAGDCPAPDSGIGWSGVTPNDVGPSGPAGNLEQLHHYSVGAPRAVRTEPLPVGGNVGSYNSFWTEQGTRVVRTGRTSLIVDPSTGRLPPLTREVHNRITSPENRRLTDVRNGRIPAGGPEELGLSERCLWYRGIPSFPTGYNNNYHIVQTPDYVAILQEHIHDVRFIPLDGRPHVPPTIRQYAGDSRGRWEGETLVVETTNFKGPLSDGGFVPSIRWHGEISPRPYR